MTTFDFDDKLIRSRALAEKSDFDTLIKMVPGARDIRLATDAEERLGIDYILTLGGGASVFVDAKSREPGCSKYWQNNMPEVALETWSVKPTWNSPGVIGWTLNESKQTDLVLFTFDGIDSNEAFLIPFQHLRVAFLCLKTLWEGAFKVGGQQTVHGSRNWKSECVFVPADIVLLAIDRVSRGRLQQRFGAGVVRVGDDNGSNR